MNLSYEDETGPVRLVNSESNSIGLDDPTQTDPKEEGNDTLSVEELMNPDNADDL